MSGKTKRRNFKRGLDRCDVCKRGREACGYCEGLSGWDFRGVCDCGLADFGRHLTNCKDREAFRYVIAQDYDSAALTLPARSCF